MFRKVVAQNNGVFLKRIMGISHSRNLNQSIKRQLQQFIKYVSKDTVIAETIQIAQIIKRKASPSTVIVTLNGEFEVKPPMIDCKKFIDLMPSPNIIKRIFTPFSLKNSNTVAASKKKEAYKHDIFGRRQKEQEEIFRDNESQFEKLIRMRKQRKKEIEQSKARRTAEDLKIETQQKYLDEFGIYENYMPDKASRNKKRKDILDREESQIQKARRKVVEIKKQLSTTVKEQQDEVNRNLSNLYNLINLIENQIRVVKDCAEERRNRVICIHSELKGLERQKNQVQEAKREKQVQLLELQDQDKKDHIQLVKQEQKEIIKVVKIIDSNSSSKSSSSKYSTGNVMKKINQFRQQVIEKEKEILQILKAKGNQVTTIQQSIIQMGQQRVQKLSNIKKMQQTLKKYQESKSQLIAKGDKILSKQLGQVQRQKNKLSVRASELQPQQQKLKKYLNTLSQKFTHLTKQEQTTFREIIETLQAKKEILQEIKRMRKLDLSEIIKGQNDDDFQQEEEPQRKRQKVKLKDSKESREVNNKSRSKRRDQHQQLLIESIEKRQLKPLTSYLNFQILDQFLNQRAKLSKIKAISKLLQEDDRINYTKLRNLAKIQNNITKLTEISLSKLQKNFINRVESQNQELFNARKLYFKLMQQKKQAQARQQYEQVEKDQQQFKIQAKIQQLDQLKQNLKQLTKEFKDLSKEFQKVHQLYKRCFLNCFHQMKTSLPRIYKQLTLTARNQYGGEVQLEVDQKSNNNFSVLYLPTPPGKRTTRFSGELSQGELSLATISFILAAREFNLSAILLFDEIDQYLDMEHMQSLCNWLKRQSEDKNFQWLLITHKAKTAELSDNLGIIASKKQGFNYEQIRKMSKMQGEKMKLRKQIQTSYMIEMPTNIFKIGQGCRQFLDVMMVMSGLQQGIEDQLEDKENRNTSVRNKRKGRQIKGGGTGLPRMKIYQTDELDVIVQKMGYQKRPQRPMEKSFLQMLQANRMKYVQA